MKKTIALTLVLTLLCSLVITSCAEKEDPAEPTGSATSVTATTELATETTTKAATKAEAKSETKTSPTTPATTPKGEPLYNEKGQLISTDLGMESLANARELGGIQTADGRTVKYGLLLRTARLNQASEADLNRLSEVYGVKTIIDLRYTTEESEDPDPEVEGAENIFMSMVSLPSEINFSGWDLELVYEALTEQDSLEDGLESAGQDIAYQFMVSNNYSRNVMTKVFDILLKANGEEAVLWHCSGGKDRTGIIAYLILSALGVEESVAMDNYMVTNVYKGEHSVEENWLTAAITVINNNYGGVQSYLRNELGLTEAELLQLQDAYLE